MQKFYIEREKEELRIIFHQNCTKELSMWQEIFPADDVPSKQDLQISTEQRWMYTP